MPQLDLTDKKILTILSGDCRTSYREIAKSLGLSVTTIKSRVDELVEAGIITDFIVEFTPAMINSEIMLVWLTTDNKEDQEQFVQEIAKTRGIAQIVPFYGGDYLIFLEYRNSHELAKISMAIKSNPHVSSTEMHTLIGPIGQKTELSNLQLRVLKELLTDARMEISDIAQRSGLTVRIVRRTLRELKESEAIRFSLRFRPNVGNRLTFLLKLRWNPKQADKDEIVELLVKDHPDEFWTLTPSAADSFLIGIAVVDNLNRMDSITTKIRSIPSVIYAEAFIYRPPYNYKGLRRLCLEEAIEALGVKRP
ncbi:MAG: winged helix-turn-helix transcriptional regulator [Promethearchaeota archaeon]